MLRGPGAWLGAAATVATGLGFHALCATGYTSALGEARIAPRYLVHAIGTAALLVAVVGLVLNVAAASARDRTGGLEDVVGSRPVGNLVLLAGRCVAQVLFVWLAVVSPLAMVQLAGLWGTWSGIGVDGYEPVSFAAFALLDTPVWLAFWCSLALLAGEVARRRLAACATVLAVWAVAVWGLFQTPQHLVPAAVGLQGFAAVASDLMPRASEPLLLRHLCTVAFAAGAVVVAAAIRRRPDSAAPWRRAAVGAALAGTGLLGIAGLLIWAEAGVEQRAAWAAVHTESRLQQRADVERAAVAVRIDAPGRLEVESELTLAMRGARADELLLALNPGMSIHGLTLGGKSVEFVHEQGLVRVRPTRPLPADEPVVLWIGAAGRPDPRFAYLDSPLDPSRRAVGDSLLPFLGTEASLYEDGFVALMPGIRWLPLPGANVGAEAPERSDFFIATVEVDVPGGWLVAGPGARAECASAVKRSCFRFEPTVPVPDVALVAAPFERSAIEVDGVAYEFLGRSGQADLSGVDEAHARAMVASVSGSAAWAGLPYPYRGFSLVVVPHVLRTYGGGWRMPSLQSMPAMMLIKEDAYPWLYDDDLRDRHWLGVFAHLARHFARDFTAGDVASAYGNLLRFQTVAGGDAAAHTQPLIDALLQVAQPPLLRVVESAGFSVHLLDTRPTLLAAATGDVSSVGDRVRRELDRPRTWELALAPQRTGRTDDPQAALSAATLRARLHARAMVDLVGDERIRELLRALRDGHAGGRFTAQELESLARGIDPLLGRMLGDWRKFGDAPGFVVSPAAVQRLSDDARGRPRYQIRAHVRNNEAGPGVVRLWCFTPSPYDPRTPPCHAVARVPGHQSVAVGIVADGPPEAIAVDTYLARNRGTVHLHVPDFDPLESVVAEPFVGAKPSLWHPVDQGIVVDDLDEGFAVETDGEFRGIGWPVPPVAVELDRGLPVYGNEDQRKKAASGDIGWARETSRWSWGRYRRTHARCSGAAGQRAVFSAELPRAGRWRLSYHVPGRLVRGFANAGAYEGLGLYAFGLASREEEFTVLFDAEASEPGWNHVGDFDLPAGSVRLTVTGANAVPRLLLADAVRWDRLD